MLGHRAESTHGSGNCATTLGLDDSLLATSQRGRISTRVHKSAVLHDLRAYPGYCTLSTPRLAASADHYRARDTTGLKSWEPTLFGPKAYTSLPSSSNVACNGGQGHPRIKHYTVVVSFGTLSLSRETYIVLRTLDITQRSLVLRVCRQQIWHHIEDNTRLGKS